MTPHCQEHLPKRIIPRQGAHLLKRLLPWRCVHLLRSLPPGRAIHHGRHLAEGNGPLAVRECSPRRAVPPRRASLAVLPPDDRFPRQVEAAGPMRWGGTPSLPRCGTATADRRLLIHDFSSQGGRVVSTSRRARFHLVDEIYSREGTAAPTVLAIPPRVGSSLLETSAAPEVSMTTELKSTVVAITVGPHGFNLANIYADLQPRMIISPIVGFFFFRNALMKDMPQRVPRLFFAILHFTSTLMIFRTRQIQSQKNEKSVFKTLIGIVVSDMVETSCLEELDQLGGRAFCIIFTLCSRRMNNGSPSKSWNNFREPQNKTCAISIDDIQHVLSNQLFPLLLQELNSSICKGFLNIVEDKRNMDFLRLEPGQEQRQHAHIKQRGCNHKNIGGMIIALQYTISSNKTKIESEIYLSFHQETSSWKIENKDSPYFSERFSKHLMGHYTQSDRFGVRMRYYMYLVKQRFLYKNKITSLWPLYLNTINSYTSFNPIISSELFFYMKLNWMMDSFVYGCLPSLYPILTGNKKIPERSHFLVCIPSWNLILISQFSTSHLFIFSNFYPLHRRKPSVAQLFKLDPSQQLRALSHCLILPIFWRLAIQLAFGCCQSCWGWVGTLETLFYRQRKIYSCTAKKTCSTACS
ncbi:hypothetical protein VP01_3275g1 [Puccinia sorghi]|uniref:Uncharacterized protein n=1 Tax=Puccinia sorghi TaxID=27349 RepID=A0A0L6UXR3_9BASI|nr:hypothetical protein VP01_3275g1 [Puccinia sorghi]